MDETTALLSLARFASALARLCLGPLLPLLTVSLGFPQQAKASLVSAYSSGSIVTQIGGGWLADRYGHSLIISASLGSSAIIIFMLTSSATTALAWTKAFFCLGLISGPLFPACSVAISSNVKLEKRAASAAIVDASISAGATVASLTPLIAGRLGWKFVYQSISVCLAMTSILTCFVNPSSNPNKKLHAKLRTSRHDDYTNNVNDEEKESGVVRSVFASEAICTYICHAADNFTKYTINSWAATMLVSKHGASASLTGIILGTQELCGVISKLIFGMKFSASSTSFDGGVSFYRRGITSAVGFIIQGLALWGAFIFSNSFAVCGLMVLSALAVGSHSIGYRTIYFETSPKHAGAISGFGNTIASFSSAIGPFLVGSTFSGGHWKTVALVMLVVNVCGSLAALGIASVVRKTGR